MALIPNKANEEGINPDDDIDKGIDIRFNPKKMKDHEIGAIIIVVIPLCFTIILIIMALAMR